MKPIFSINRYEVWREKKDVVIGDITRLSDGSYDANGYFINPLGTYRTKVQALHAILAAYRKNAIPPDPMGHIIRISCYDVWHETKDVRIGRITRQGDGTYRANGGFGLSLGKFPTRAKAADAVVKDYLKDPAKKDRYPWR